MTLQSRNTHIKNYFIMNDPTAGGHPVELLLRPETETECNILQDIDFRAGLNWGVPRFGHPEGKVLYHIREVLDNVDKLNVDAKVREQLRLITFIHDTFKNIEDKNRPRDWSRHHAVLARQFAEKYIEDQAVLDVIELHDEAYYSWRSQFLSNRKKEGEQRLQNLLERLQDNLQLYYLFFKCDTCTGDKIQAPLQWFEQSIEGIEVINFSS